MIHTDVLIIGAGLSGLMAARLLQESGRQVIVLDKGRGVGGRMATRRLAGGLGDHGAQFFTVRDPAFAAYVDRWIDEGLVYLWSRGFSQGSLAQVTDDGHPRYAVHGGMNALMKHLAQPLKDVRVETTATQVQPQVGKWLVRDRAAHEYLAHTLILTAPVPQSLALLDDGNTRLHADDRAQLERIRYEPCLTGLFVFDDHDHVRLPEPGAVQRREAPISWIANNRQKGISDVTIITAQASGTTSAQLWDADDERILNALLTDIRVYLPEGVNPKESQLKRWRYSWVSVTHPHRYLIAQGLPPLAFAGDAFGTSRVEGAFLSGVAVGEALCRA